MNQLGCIGILLMLISIYIQLLHHITPFNVMVILAGVLMVIVQLFIFINQGRG